MRTRQDRCTGILDRIRVGQFSLLDRTNKHREPAITLGVWPQYVVVRRSERVDSQQRGNVVLQRTRSWHSFGAIHEVESCLFTTWHPLSFLREECESFARYGQPFYESPEDCHSDTAIILPYEVIVSRSRIASVLLLWGAVRLVEQGLNFVDQGECLYACSPTGRAKENSWVLRVSETLLCRAFSQEGHTREM
ncbi:hypothetical protein BU24DRAFT_420764 [Aaosphaeria arxii CBS 175.79]|uniref:Uncharacterized protein n=1 Tax=Aaosphaeria arxii CBS 175.79 TaxID=1450172 RepID=A0A6A5XWL1_9PLEO|nr:uncharacterized protein BU24DRAFT_420764 [Aaosphaeria arxii CBS 175.79]KAF2017718.1 hypothetical protein BU24DRAFT_420764 [Aaosphaeria arxii CBS 175.79]